MANYLFLMDPLEEIHYEKDTTYAIMMCAHKRAHSIYFLPKTGISYKSNKLYFHCSQVTPQENPKQPFIIKESNLTLCEDQVDALFIRTDPPFDTTYLNHTWLLEKATTPFIINNPQGIRNVNEKIWTTQFNDIVPDTLITQSKKEYLTYLNTHKTIIINPLDGYGGTHIFKVKKDDTNAAVIFESVLKTGPALIQSFIPEASKGDKRILLLNGDPLGAILRVQQHNDHRHNFMTGREAYPTTITKRDKDIIQTLKPKLIKEGLYFVGIDIIGDYLIEVNVTSPTCLQEINRAYDISLEYKIIDFVESQSPTHQ